MVNPTTSPLIFSKLLYNIYLPLPIFLPPTNKNYLVIFLNPSPPELPFLRSLPYISLRKTQGRCPKDGGVNKTEGLKNSNSNKIKSQPLPLPCPVTLQGVTYKIGAEAKGKYISPSSPVWRRHIGEVARSDGGVEKTEGVRIQARAQSPIPPLSGGEDARETKGKGRGLSERNEFRRPRRRP